ncbi:MAG: hypothetical protein Q7S19_01565 [bacterium]|nr:hypothetical protein [bacterium]
MFQDNNGGGYSPKPQRQMFQGNWKCGTCNGEITQLPFEPDPSRLGTLLCRDCHKNKQSYK